MYSIRRQILLKTFVGFDLLILAASFYVSVFGRDSLRPLAELSHSQVQLHVVLAMAVLLYGWHLLFELVGIHRSRRLNSHFGEEVLDLLKVAVSGTILLWIVTKLFRMDPVTPFVLACFLIVSCCTLIASRLIMRPMLKAARRHGHNLRHLVIAGTNARALEFMQDVLAQPELGYRLDGFIDRAWVGPKSPHNAARLVCDVDGFRSYLRDHVVDELVIALPLKSSYAEANDLVEVCREQGIVVRVLSDLFTLSTGKMRIDHFDRSAVVSIYTFPLDGLSLAAKRFLDVAVSGVLLLLLSPLLLAIGLLVRLDSEGPAIFAQERVGFNKRRFAMYKFRTMVVNAAALQAQLESRNEAQGPIFKIKDDPRITRCGTFLRKTSIDELPQLFNVLRGDMSLVGPRPLPVRDYNGFDKDWQRRRFSVYPGITCLWQIGGRSSISFNQWMDLDMEYIDNWSFWLDMKILARTIPAVVRGSGAA